MKARGPKPPQCRLPAVSGASCHSLAEGRSAEHIVSAALGLSFCFVVVVAALLLLLLGQVVFFGLAIAEWGHAACDQPLVGWLVGLLLVAVITLLLTALHQLTGDPLVDDEPSPFSPGCCLWAVQAFAVLWVLFGALLYATTSTCHSGLTEFSKWALVWASLGAPLVLGCVVCIGACFGSTALASASALGMLEGERDCRRASLPKLQPTIPMMRRGATKEVLRLLCNLKARESALQSLTGSCSAEESKSAELGKQMAEQLILLEEQSEQIQEQLVLIRYQSQLMESSREDMLEWQSQQKEVLQHLRDASSARRQVRQVATDYASADGTSGCAADEDLLQTPRARAPARGRQLSDSESQAGLASSDYTEDDAPPQAAWKLVVQDADEVANLVDAPESLSEELMDKEDQAVQLEEAPFECPPLDGSAQLDDVLPEARELAGESQVDVEIKSQHSNGASDEVKDPWDCPQAPV